MLSTHLIFFGCWVVYYALHSILALNSVKARVPLSARAYRLVYSLLSTVLLFYVLILGAVQPTYFLIEENSNTKLAALILSIIGVFIIKRAFRNYSLRSFLGLKKEESGTLKTDGIQARMRHPLYTGTVLIVVSWFFFSPTMINLTTVISMLLYLPVGIWLEEKKLIQQFGDAYLEYRQKVPPLFPNPFRKS